MISKHRPFNDIEHLVPLNGMSINHRYQISPVTSSVNRNVNERSMPSSTPCQVGHIKSGARCVTRDV